MKRLLLVSSLLVSICSLQGAIPTTLPLVSSNETVVLPHQIGALYIIDDAMIRSAERAYSSNGLIMLLALKPQPDHSNYFKAQDLYSIGTVASILQLTQMPGGGVKVVVKGISRASVYDMYTQKNMLVADVKHLSYIKTSDQEVIKAMNAIKNFIAQASQYNLGEFATLVLEEQDPEKLVNMVVNALNINGEKVQRLLECNSHVELLKKTLNLLEIQFGSIAVKDKISQDALENIQENEKKYILTEQLKAIKKQLSKDNSDSLEAKLAALPLPDEVRREVDRQLSRLEQMPATMPEASIIEGYLEWICELPWGVHTDDNLDIAHAKQILNDDHFGLEKIKERILDYIAIRKLTNDNKAPILCFVGPPGTGKTSLAKSIARSLGRNFARISVGGVRDEAEIRGHRRTYVAAMPGRILECVRKAGSMNPVVLIDEIDKMGHNSIHGNPSAAMLEVLDPEQNSDFRDHYLGSPFDLSNVLFIATANTLSTLPRPLLDRMEVIEVSGYSQEEKRAIAKNYLIKKAIDASGIEGHPLVFSDELLNTIISDYTMESGVRELERMLKKLCAKAARILVEEKLLVTFTPDNLEEYLGPKKFTQGDDFEKVDQVGITNGLAWTSYGGSMGKIEALIMPGTGQLHLTGSLGDVLKESAKIALSYARAHAEEYDIAPELFTEYDLHIHLPEGAMKKDGPSGGITLLSSIISALTGRKINADYAMTGELNLRGNIMPIGGVKEKILAAKRNNINNVILPMKNKKDMVNIEDVTKDINVIFVRHASEVLNHVLMSLEQV